MMYLFDTNIFLEILLAQEKSENCKKAMLTYMGNIAVSDFSLHSIGVILFRYDREDVFKKFTTDVLSGIEIVSLPRNLYNSLSKVKKETLLDFDDSYQYLIAEENNFTLVTMDKHFDRVKDKIRVAFI